MKAVKDAVDNKTATATFSVSVLGPMTVSGVSAKTIRAGEDAGAASYTATATNALDPAKVLWSLSSGSTGPLPSGVTIEPATGKLAGIPDASAAGKSFPGLKLMAQDKDLSQAESSVFSVKVNPALDFVVADQQATEGVPFTYTPSRSGLVGAPSWTATGLPTGLTMTPGTGSGATATGGVIQGTPGAPGMASPYTVSISLRDGDDAKTVTRTLKLAVAAAPVLAVTPANTSASPVALTDQFMPDTQGPCTTLTVANTGSVAATGMGWSFPASDQPYFAAGCTPTGTACGSSLDAGKSCTIGVSLAGADGTAIGPHTGILELTATGIQKKSVYLKGTIKPAFDSFTFDTCGRTGSIGPTLAQCRAWFSTSDVAWIQDPNKYNVTNGYQVWTVPVSGTYRISAKGAQGGINRNSNPGSLGAVATSRVTLTAGEKVYLLVGQMGEPGESYGNGSGGSFAVKGTNSSSPILAIGGGGGGAGYTLVNAPTGTTLSAVTSGANGDNARGNCYPVSAGTGSKGGTGGYGGFANCGGGGGGFYGAGERGPYQNGWYAGGGGAYVSGGTGGNGRPGAGGFGGGGAQIMYEGAGGGGGYSGGGASGYYGGGFGGGGGGGSYFVGTGPGLGAVQAGAGQGSITITLEQ